jgi:hypothetical protein
VPVLTVVGLLKLDWCDVSVLFVEPGVVEPVDVVQGGDLDFLDGLAGLVGIDQLGLVQPHNGLREGVVIGVPDGADRRRNPYRGEAFGERYRRVLGSGDALLFVKRCC